MSLRDNLVNFELIYYIRVVFFPTKRKFVQAGTRTQNFCCQTVNALPIELHGQYLRHPNIRPVNCLLMHLLCYFKQFNSTGKALSIENQGSGFEP